MNEFVEEPGTLGICSLRTLPSPSKWMVGGGGNGTPSRQMRGDRPARPVKCGLLCVGVRYVCKSLHLCVFSSVTRAGMCMCTCVCVYKVITLPIPSECR